MTTPTTGPAWLASLVAVLARLAAPADVQSTYLEQLGVGGSLDELALEFDDVFRPVEAQIENNSYWTEALASLRELDRALSSEHLRWTGEALRDADWEQIPRLATTAESLVSASADRTARS